ncbi:MAG: type IVB secretion system protein DotA [Gammaproteobacteria bacterium]|nr:type IVB secretion system protein DotA [Gammaproteobacteria bacterium]
MKFCKKIFWTVFLLIPNLAIAATPTDPFLSTHNLFSPSPSDFSMEFLRQIFGQVGSVLVGPQKTIIDVMFGVFNAGIISIASLFLIYTTVKTVIDTAQEGDAMGRKLSHWTAIRTALGIGMLVPKFNGYSFVQVIVMWVVIQGIGLADHTWKAAINYLQKGGVVYFTNKDIRQTGITVNNHLISSGGASSSMHCDKSDPECLSNPRVNPKMENDNVAAVDIYRSLVCMYSITTAKNNERLDMLQRMKDHPRDYPKEGTAAYSLMKSVLSRPIVWKPKFDSDIHTLYFPGKTGEYYQDYRGICGIYYYGVKKDGDYKPNYTKAKRSGLQHQIDLLEPYAKSVVREANKESQGQQYNTNLLSDDEQGAQLMVNSAMSYQSAVYNERFQFNRHGPLSSDADYYDEAKDHGWAMAGRYYYDIMRTRSGGIDNAHYKATISSHLFTPFFKSNPVRLARFKLLRRYLPSIFDDLSGLTSIGYPPANDGRNTPQRGAVFNDFGSVFGSDSQEIALMGQALSLGSDARNRALGIAQQLDAHFKHELEQTKISDFKTGTKKKDKNYFGNVRDFEQHFFLSYDQGNKSDWKLSSKGGAKKVFNRLKRRTKRMTADSVDFIADVVQNHVNEVADAWYMYMVQYEGYNPIRKLASLGSMMLVAVGDMWHTIKMVFLWVGGTFQVLEAIPVIAAFVTGAFSSGEAQAFSSAASLIHHVASFLMAFLSMSLPLATAISVPMFVMGFTLAVYVPLIPYLLFLFGVIGWLIFVIEAMAAAPLVALGITHPEGHDLLGKSEQAVMLLLSVFLRPVAMIIGLIAGIVLSFIGVEILNAGFGAFISKGSGIIAHSVTVGKHHKVGVAYMVRDLGALLIYTFTVVAIINQSFGLIYVIPEKIMRWLGLHPDQSQAPQLLDSVKAGAQPFAEAGGRAGGEQASSMKQSMGTRHFTRSDFVSGSKAKKDDGPGTETQSNPPAGG